MLIDFLATIFSTIRSPQSSRMTVTAVALPSGALVNDDELHLFPFQIPKMGSKEGRYKSIRTENEVSQQIKFWKD